MERAEFLLSLRPATHQHAPAPSSYPSPPPSPIPVDTPALKLALDVTEVVKLVRVNRLELLMIMRLELPPAENLHFSCVAQRHQTLAIRAIV